MLHDPVQLYLTVYGAMRDMLYKLPVKDLRSIAGAAGFDITQFTPKPERPPIFGEMDRQFGSWPVNKQATALSVMAIRVCTGDPEKIDRLRKSLLPLGIDYVGGAFVPIGLFDARDAAFVAPDAVGDLSKASSRLADGDYSGAISAACGAVDTVTQRLYDENNLGQPPNSFQAKVNTAAEKLGLWGNLRSGYEAGGMSSEDAITLVKHFQEATNHAAQALQILRRAQGDVHGSKGTTIHAAFQAIKWASALCALLTP